MEKLFKGIVTQFDAQITSPHDLAGKLYLSEVPQNFEAPYVVFHLISKMPEYFFVEQLEECVIQFDVYTSDVSSANCCDYYDDILSAFDDQLITVADHNTIKFERENSMLLRDIDIGMWRYFIQYRIILGV